jgi:hypothetical protein
VWGWDLDFAAPRQHDNMADQPRDASPGSSSSHLLAAFSRRHSSYQQMPDEGAGDIGLADFNPANSQQRFSSSTYLSPTMDSNSKDMALSPNTIRSVADDSRPISPVTTLGNDQDTSSTPGAASPDLPSGEMRAAPTSRKPSKKSKFTEILRRSLSSSWDSRDRSAAPRYEPTRDMAGLSPSSDTPEIVRDSSYLHPITEYDGEQGERDRSRNDADNFSLRYSKFSPLPRPPPVHRPQLITIPGQPPLDCHSRRDVHIRRRSWLYIILVILSVYSTLLSGLWFVVSILQPRYGKGISSSTDSHAVAPSTASLVTALFSKTTELSFVTVFVAFVGQVLTRRAFVKQARGMTLAEMTMRNWVIQPGSLFTHWDNIPQAAGTFLGVLTLLATLCGIFYTTASDAMVTPKLIFGGWEFQELKGLVQASYANPYFVLDTCTTPINKTLDPSSAPSCLDVYYSGQSYRNLLAYMKVWEELDNNGTPYSSTSDIYKRPAGTSLLYDNTTMYSTWIEGESSDPAKQYVTEKRVINNATLAMPHPGVYQAATDDINGILQPNDLSGVGEYQIRASVGSPTVNVLCMNMNKTELAPLVYTEWPHAAVEETGVPGQTIGNASWINGVPVASDDEWLNSTVVDDLFKWGKTYKRRPPVFQLVGTPFRAPLASHINQNAQQFPINYNMITNTTVQGSDSIYLLAKSGTVQDYTLCQLRSWVTSKCSTQFNISGIAGAQMRAHCEDPSDTNAYFRSVPGIADTPSVDWKNLADEWRLSMDLNGGISNNNASNARILTDFIIGKASLNPQLPSMAEALAVLASATLVIGSQLTTFRQYWDASYGLQRLDKGVYEAFNSTLKMQQYASSHTERWQAIFYPVLGFVFLINVLCLAYLIFVHGMVTDYTEPRNMFALAVNSPPSRQLDGSCGGGPHGHEMNVPWRVAYAESANHYYFEEGEDISHRAKFSKVGTASGSNPLADGSYRSSYKRLSSSRAGTWL